MCFKKVQGKQRLTLIFTCSLVPPDHLDFRDNPCAVLVVEQSARSRWREEKIQTNNMKFSSEGHVLRYTLCLWQFASISAFRAANHHPSIICFFLVFIFSFPPFFLNFYFPSFLLLFPLECSFCLWCLRSRCPHGEWASALKLCSQWWTWGVTWSSIPPRCLWTLPSTCAPSTGPCLQSCWGTRSELLSSVSKWWCWLGIGRMAYRRTFI